MGVKVVGKGTKSETLKGQMANTSSGRAVAAQESLDPVVKRAIEVMGNKEKALRWLGSPVRALDYATPISLIGTSDGKESVMAVLTRLEHGVL